MVFLSTLQALFGRPLSRNVFAFGTRQLTRVLVVEELAMGLLLVFPLSLILAALTIRISAKSIPYVRSDIYTTLWITVVGDLFLEILLPSLQCVPMNQLLDDISYGSWLSQTWGFQCPPHLSRDALLSTDAVGTLLTLRLIFMCLGIYLGEAFIPVALTGGIASGKSTVAQMLQDPKRLYVHKNNRQRKRQKSNAGSNNSAANALSAGGSSGNSSSILDSDEEGSFEVIDVDRIAHEVLLPPSVLGGDEPAPHVDPPYTTPPQYSLYKQILQTFDGHDIVDEDGMIDRRKLGTIIFQDHSLRRQLNRLTHPRILFLMMLKIFRGIFLGSKDIVCADIPLLFESGQLRRLFAVTICVATPKELQFERLRKRNPDLSEQECWNRINSQMTMDEKVKRADLVVWNTGTSRT